MDILLEPFGFQFFRYGLLAAVMVGGLCGLIGVYVVLRHMSYIGHGLSHAVFGGAVVSFLMNWNFYLGAGAWGFLAALLINATARKRQIGADAAIGIITTASFALGVALISHARSFTRDFEAALFGNVLGIERADLYVIAGVTAMTLMLVFFFYKQLLFTTFDPEVAPAYGVPRDWVDTLLALILAAAIIASMNVMGVTLIAAALVIPPVIARLLTDSFGRLLITSTLVGAFCGFAGMMLSWYLNASSGATIVLFAALLFLVTMAWQGLRDRQRLRRLAGAQSSHDVLP
jgi:manganese/iron transport system permease protein/iron/zinc/copper transport system permease protein